ncbi:MAG: peptide chain release factor 1 [Bacillota bacterium]|nr:MAG: peptide chain release factor 1 [Bacillota bacterium]
MFDKLAELERQFIELEQRLGDPEVLQDPVQLQKVAKAHADLEEIVSRYREYKQVTDELQATRAMLEEQLEPELRELAKEELARLEEREEELRQELRRLLLPKDPNDEKNIIMEIRAGAGGEEAALFAADLFRMYTRYAENRGWRVEMMSASPTELGGFKEVIFMIHGKNAYSRLKYESGVHRVQRVPVTEASGRIHTSTATVAVLPEAEEVDVEIRPEDLRIDVFRSGGHGGQSVNTTDSAVRITHLPTGLVVTCQDERSQLQNKEKALRVLRARLLDMKRRAQEEELAQARRSQVGTGERSERIRTYNFPQGRMTDHRIGLTLYRLDSILEGDLDEVIDALILADQMEQLQRQEAEA